MIRRSILLAVYLIAGCVLGDLLAWLILIPVALVKHLTDAWVGTVADVGGEMGGPGRVTQLGSRRPRRQPSPHGPSQRSCRSRSSFRLRQSCIT
jgi:hypothetical protein